jgi:hypothetical protein
MEFMLRVTDPTNYDRFTSDTVSGLLHFKPGATYTNAGACFSNEVRPNAEGFYGAEWPTTAKTPKEFRIVLVGSSFAEGNSAPTGKTPAAFLEQKLNAIPDKRYRYVVIPIAFSGNGTYLDILYYLRYGRPLKPDLVVDISSDYEHVRDAPVDYHFDSEGNLLTSLPPLVKNPLTSDIKNILRKSKLVMNLFKRYLVLKGQGLAEAIHDGATDPDYKATQWQHEEQLLGAFAGIIRKDRASLLLASWATPETGTAMATALSEHLSHTAVQHLFDYIDIMPSMAAQEKASGKSASWTCDAHWSDVGNEYAAQAIVDYLEKHPSLLVKKI